MSCHMSGLVHLAGGGEGWFESVDIRACVPVALILSLPVTPLVDVHGLSGDRVLEPLEPHCLVVVLVGA